MINSLGIKKSPKDTKVVVAMSGGVDSSVVAGLKIVFTFLMINLIKKSHNLISQGKNQEIIFV